MNRKLTPKMGSLKQLLSTNFNFKSIKKLFATYTTILFIVLGTILFWFMYKTYASHMEVKKLEMDAAASEIELSFINMLNYTESIMDHIGKQISISDGSTQEISDILSFFSEKSSRSDDVITDALSLSMFSWANKEDIITINSEYGLLQRPTSISYRDYLQSTFKSPWVMYTGTPVLGAVSGQQIIPAGLAVTSQKNRKHMGTIAIGFAANRLSERLRSIVDTPNLDFAILDKDGNVLLESTVGIFSEDKKFLRDATNHINKKTTVSSFSPFALDGSFLIIKPTEKYTYHIVSGYQNSFIMHGLISTLLPYLIALLAISLIFFIIWRILESRIISPIIQLSIASKLIAKDREVEAVMPRSSVSEIIELTKQIKLIERYKINLLQTKRSQERFFANMSHELRTPLNGILNFSTMMKGEMMGPLNEDYKEMSGDIYESGSHLLNLVNDILDFSKMDIGKMKLREETFSILKEADGAIKIIDSDTPTDKNSDKKISYNLEKGLSFFYGDRRMFKQILLNLLSNASKFVESGEINLNIFTDDQGSLIVEVVDTGIGIKEEDLSKLTVEFGQVGDGYSRGKKQGSGLGLFLCKKMAELHEGKFEITSIYGKGTTAKVTFPRERIIRDLEEENE